MFKRSVPVRMSAIAAIAFTLPLFLITACGGSSAATNPGINTPPASNPQPQAIVGIDTPSSVAVVTATNAQ